MGILAYGSLKDDSGGEIGPLITKKIEDVKTPFRVEFARKSRTRDGAPTLVPVSKGGANVNATILVLEERVCVTEARNMLWRRETRREGSGESYVASVSPDANTVLVRRLEGFGGLDVVFAEIGANILDPDPRKLAELAIHSAGSDAGREGKDGIKYLIDVKKNGVQTPLMPEYERAILRIMGIETLERAREKLIGKWKA